MMLDSIPEVLWALDRGSVRYLIVGGVAVNLHGYVRATRDLDLVIEPDPDNATRAIHTLRDLGYRPQVPVAIEGLADPAKRQHWVEDKGMEVCALTSDTHPDTTLDLFTAEPFDFEAEHAAAVIYEIAPELRIPVVRPEALITMKRNVVGHRDLDDIEHLERILTERKDQADNNARGTDGDWSTATWAGSRRAQLRRALQRTPSERLEAMVSLSDMAEQLASVPPVTDQQVRERSTRSAE